MGSGFAEDDDDGVDQTSSSPADTGPAPDSGDPWMGTEFVGDISAVLTVTYTPMHAYSNTDAVGLAGGYRTAEAGWDGSEDLYSPMAYLLALPTPPEAADTLLPAEPLPAFDWLEPEDWFQAGNGMKLRAGEGGPELLGCLVPAGEYPVYRTSAAMGVAAECNPDPTAWTPQTVYDVVLYGGDLFVDNILPERVTSPSEFTVSAPDLSIAEVPVDSTQDLSIAWDASDDPETRIIIRVIDADANVITVHAADDGDYTIPAAELAALTLGPMDLIITRERTDLVQFTNGGLTVLGRYERWGFFDLI